MLDMFPRIFLSKFGLRRFYKLKSLINDLLCTDITNNVYNNNANTIEHSQFYCVSKNACTVVLDKKQLCLNANYARTEFLYATICNTLRHDLKSSD